MYSQYNNNFLNDLKIIGQKQGLRSLTEAVDHLPGNCHGPKFKPQYHQKKKKILNPWC
jgi:hypothetical protein